MVCLQLQMPFNTSTLDHQVELSHLMQCSTSIHNQLVTSHTTLLVVSVVVPKQSPKTTIPDTTFLVHEIISKT